MMIMMINMTGPGFSGRFVIQEQRERWRAKRISLKG